MDARQHGGKWLVRIEDLDTPRCVPGAADDILRTLEHFGFEWDGPVMFQSERGEAYRAALERLPVYACTCSRKSLDSCQCRNLIHKPEGMHSVRVFGGRTIGFEDRHFGWFEQQVDDFVVRRADGLFAYQLAVVVDDAEQGVTDIVRGSDLLDSTPRQIFLQQELGMPKIRYKHVPVVRNADGEKLSKQTLAPALDWALAAALLNQAALHLGWPPAEAAGPRELLRELAGGF